MTDRLDRRALGYGVATFVASSVALVFAGQLIPGSSFIALVVLIPVAAGYISAYHATSNRITHGIIAGAIGAVLLLVPMLLIPGPALPIPAIVLLYLALASLGAFVADYRRRKLGA